MLLPKLRYLTLLFGLGVVACSSYEIADVTATPELVSDGTTPDGDGKEGKKCGGPTNIRCAKGFACMVGDEERNEDDEGQFGLCAKAPCDDEDSCEDSESGEDEEPGSGKLCKPNDDVLCLCTDQQGTSTRGTKKCSSDGKSFSSCNCKGNSGGRLCTPKTETYCECSGGRPGTKKCSSDGSSFAACSCT